MKISFNPSNSNKNILDLIKNNKDIIFDLRGHSIFARGVEFKGTDTNTWRDIKINNVSIGSHTLDLRNGSNTTLTNTNGVVTINSTWRPVVDNLTSDSTTSSLSAKQGKVLKALIEGKSDSDHNHDDQYVKKSGDTMWGALTIDTTEFGALIIKRNDDINNAVIQFRGKSSVYGCIGLNPRTKDKQFLRWNSDSTGIYTILDTSSTHILPNGEGVINGTIITQVNNAINSINSTNARKLVNWYSVRPTSLNAQFGDGSLRLFYATSSTTEGKPAENSHILHLAWDNTDGYDAQLAVHTRSGKVSTRAQNGGTWQPWKTLALTSDIPTVTNYYWANVKISASSSTTTSPTFSHVYLGNILHLNNRGYNSIFNGPNDSANGLGGPLNNLVFSSWWGVSFTTSCSEGPYASKNAVSIDCRTGQLYAGNVWAQGFKHLGHSDNDAVLLAGGGYKTLKDLIFLSTSYDYTDGIHFRFRFYKLSGICNNLVWVDGHVKGYVATTFAIDPAVFPYPYDNDSGLETIYPMSENSYITVNAAGIVTLNNTTDHRQRVGFFYVGKA